MRYQTQNPTSKQREKDNIRTRNGSLIFLAFGTAISSAMIGMELAGHFELNFILRFMMILFCVAFAYISVDSAVRNNLFAAADKNESEELQSYFQKKSIIALIITVFFSIGASYFVGQNSKGENPHLQYNATLNDFSKRDSTNKSLAAATLLRLSQEQKTDISAIKKAAAAAEKKLVSDKSISWKKDYQAAKNNPNHWTWICNQCPTKYKIWRDEIQKIRNDRDVQIAEIKNSTTKIKNDLATTLTYSIESDTTISKMGIYTNLLAKERQDKARLITLILILLTISAAFGAYGANNNLKKIRSVHGQFITDGDQLIFDVVEDFLLNLLRQFLGVVFGLLNSIDKGLEKIGIDLYEIGEQRIVKYKNADRGQNPEQSDQSRPIISAFGQNKPDQSRKQRETFGDQDFSVGRPTADQSRPAPTNRSGDQLVEAGQPKPIDQPRPVPTNRPAATSPDQSAKTIIEKETKIVRVNVNLSQLKSGCKRDYLRSFYPSNDSQYLKRNTPPGLPTLKRNEKKHLAKVEELKSLGVKIIYEGEGQNKTCKFIFI